MLRKIKNLLSTIGQFFVQKPPADLTWRWVWDEDAGKVVKQDSNPWLGYYAKLPQKSGKHFNRSPSEPNSLSEWNSETLIRFSQDKSQGFLPGISQKINR